MRKMVFFVLAAAVLSLMVPAQNAQAQSETPKVEIGAHYTRLRLRVICKLPPASRCDSEAECHMPYFIRHMNYSLRHKRKVCDVESGK